MNERLQILLQALLVWLAAQYLLAPLIVRLIQTLPERFDLPYLDWQYLLRRWPQTQGRHQELLQLGFEPVAATQLPAASTILYGHPHDAAGAALTMTKRFVSNEFSQFGAKAVLSVSSAPLPSVFPAWQRKISFRFSTCKGVADLHEHFQRIRAKTDLGQRTPVPPGQRLAQLESFLNQEQGHLIERGYFAPVARRGKRHVTLKGAYLMTWKMAWPSKPILIWLADRRTERAAA